MMRWLRQRFDRLRSSFPSVSRDGELDAEMASHLELATEENIKSGMSPEEAHRHALLKFGGVEQAKAKQHEARGFHGLDILWLDLRYTFRTMRRDPVFTLVAVLILTLGIGANIAVFSVVNTIMLQPLPFHDPQQLVWIAGSKGVGGRSAQTYSSDAYKEFIAQNHVFESVTAYFAFSTDDNMQLMGNGEPQPITGISVAQNFFGTLGVKPILGRSFTADECRHNAAPVILLSYGFWRQHFAADRNIVGRAVRISDQSMTVIGVLPEAFDFGSVFEPGSKVDVYAPAILDDMEDWGNGLSLIGRLKPGVNVAQAQAEADLVFPRLHFTLKHLDWGGGYSAKLTILKEYVSGKLRRSLIVLWCAVGMILLIVCVNLSNLLLARTAARDREFAMRSALGAGRARLIRQLLTESFVLSLAGAALGLAMAYGAVAWFAHQGSLALPLLNELKVDPKALGWTLLIAILAAALFGLAPGLRFSRVELQNALKDGGHGASTGKRHDRMRSALVITEVALACVLLVGAGLLLRSFLRVLDIDLGFNPSHSAAISVDYDDQGSPAKRGAILKQMIDKVKAIPGIQAAGITDMLPLDRNRSWRLTAKGVVYSPQNPPPDALVQIVTPGYLAAMGMRLKEGRDFAWSDGANSQRVVVVSESAAKRLWPGQDPIGRIALLNEDRRVIGVVADVRNTGVEEAAGLEAYLPTTQAGPEGAELVVRTTLPPDVLANSVMATLRSMNPGQPATEFRPLESLVNHAVSPRRFFVVLTGAFAGLGLLLACLGIYGVISYSVTRRTQEIGIRMALGASRAHVQFAVIASTMRLVLTGIAMGLIASFVVARLIATLLFKTAPGDPITFAAISALLILVSLFAGYLPARRASRIDPIVALRTE